MKSDPFTGRYLFHLHTTFTDGQVTVRQYFEAAAGRLDRLIFLEHIRVQPRYDVHQFAATVRGCAGEFGIPALVGFEAKLLPGGALDIEDEHAALADVLGIAEHGFPANFGLWHASLTRALEAGGRLSAEKPAVWVHPGLWLKKHGLLETYDLEYREFLRYAQALGVRVERNRRYGLLPEHLAGTVRPEFLVNGADAHGLADVAAAVAEMDY